MRSDDISLVRWPEEAEARADLARSGRARVLLVPHGEALPSPVDDLEDWISVPASELDLHRRIAWLQRRLGLVADDVRPPSLDGDGRLRATRGEIELGPTEARIVQALLDHYGSVVSREAMARAGWPATTPTRNTVDVQVLRLRRHLASVGLCLVTVRRRGYRLQADTPNLSDICQASDNKP